MKKIFALFALAAFSALNGMCATTTDTLSLNGSWDLTYWNQPATAITSPQGMQGVKTNKISAQVPGNVEIDLLAAGLIKDPMIGNNVNDLRPWEGCEWCYTKTFTATTPKDGDRKVLFFGGIDCLADIWLNGKHIGSARDMMIEHKYDVTKYLKDGENTLQVIIRSAVLEGQKYMLGTLSVGNFPSEESIFTRKAPHMYGWDILPRLVSAGLWRDVALLTVHPVHIRDVNYSVANVDAGSGSAVVYADMQVSMPMDKFDKTMAIITLSRKGKVAARIETHVVSPAFRAGIALQNADLWWPRGYGEPALYDAKVELVDSANNVLAVDNKRIGLRTVKLERKDTNKSGGPESFCFVVNGERIFIHGTNWVPVDALHSRDKREIRPLLDMAVDLNCNMIRSWGGSVIEDDDFFNFCDENGILVWQDFTMGCTIYPQRSSFTRMIEKEVQAIVIKLRNHPSLALWSGNNEDDAVFYWSLRPFGLDPNKDVVTRTTIPQVLYEFDVTRPYLPSSPYYSEELYNNGGAEELMPEDHLWGPRGYYKDGYYTGAKACFVSEIGYHGCPNLESLKKMMTKDCVYPWSSGHNWNEEWLTKSVRRFSVLGNTQDRNNLMINQINLLFGEVPSKLEDFIFASQSVQAEAMKYFIEMWRGQKFTPKTGIIWWNLRDGWPLISDAIVDFYNSKKMAYYFIRNVQKDVCVLMNDASNGSYPLIAVNDTRQEAKGNVVVTDVESGEKVFEGSFTVPVNSKTEITRIAERTGQGMFLIKYTVNGKDFGNHYLYGKAPFKSKDYKKWLAKTNLYNNIIK